LYKITGFFLYSCFAEQKGLQIFCSIFNKMKKWVLPVLVIFFLLPAAAQDIKKQIEELDSAFSSGDYKRAKALIGQIHPTAATRISNDTLLVEFLGTCGAVYYRLNEFATAENYFREAAEKAKATLGEKEYHYALALFNLAS